MSFKNWVLTILGCVAFWTFMKVTEAANLPPATMMVFNQGDKSLKGVLYWENMGECRIIRKKIIDFLWAIGSDGMYYITCTPQKDID